MPNPYNEPPTNLGQVLALAYGIDARPYDTVEQLWAKVATALGASVTPYDNLDAIFAAIVNTGGAAPCPPCPPCPECMLSAEPNTEALMEQLWFNPSNNNDPVTVVTAITMGMTAYLGQMDWENCPDLTALNFSNLASFGDGSRECALYVIDLPNLATLSVPLLATFQSNSEGTDWLIIDSCPALVNLSFPSLVTLSKSDLRVTQNSALTSFSAPLWMPSVNCDANFSDNALSQTSVDHILARHVASPTWGNNGEELDLSGGTNAAPGAQGLLDVATLLGRGAAVDTN